MSWKMSRITSSLMGLLGELPSDSKVNSRLEDIREAMQDVMMEAFEGDTLRPVVWSKVMYASDIQGLWYLRTDLMTFLSEHSGERIAREKLATLTELFRGAIPSRQMASATRVYAAAQD
jgi:hypothetical protein